MVSLAEIQGNDTHVLEAQNAFIVKLWYEMAEVGHQAFVPLFVTCGELGQ